jgi:hypothetical protein
LNCEGGDAARHRHTELAQNFFALVFVDFHDVSLGTGQFSPNCDSELLQIWHWTHQFRNVSCCNASNLWLPYIGVLAFTRFSLWSRVVGIFYEKNIY